MSGIGYVFQDHYPWDVRAEKIVDSLSQAGYPTVVISRNRTGAPTLEHLGERLDVVRLPRGFDRVSRELLNFPAFFSPVWVGTLVATILRRQLDLLFVRDLPLALAAYWAGRLTGRPVVLDMAENYPAMIADTWRYRGPGPLDHVLRNPRLLRRLERWILPRMDAILPVSEASAARVRELVAGSRARIWVVGNTPRLEGAEHAAESELARRTSTARGLKLLYVGGLEESRGLDVVIRALPLIQRSIGSAHLVICGQGTSRTGLQKLAGDLGVADSVDFAGWVDPRDVPGVIAAADVCIVPHYVTEHTDTTVPNKIFDYMLQSKPVVVTHSRSLCDIVEQHECGLSYHDDRPHELAQAVQTLADPALRAAMGSRGRHAVLRELNWAHEETTLLAAVAALTSPPTPPCTS